MMRDALAAFGGDPDEALALARRPRRGLRRGPYRAGAGAGGGGPADRRRHRDQRRDAARGRGGRRRRATPARRRWRCAATPSPPPPRWRSMIERRARAEPDLVATVGRMEVWPGAANVIPGHAQFSIDLRAPLDARREAALADIRAGIDAIARERRVAATVAITHEAPAFTCDPRIVAGLRAAVESLGVAGAAAAVGGRARHDGDRPLPPGRHAVRPLQGRHQPQPAGVDHGRGLRLWPRRARPASCGLSSRLERMRAPIIIGLATSPDTRWREEAHAGKRRRFFAGHGGGHDRGRSPFSPFAEDIARRMGGFSSGALLEVAAGTGIVTTGLGAGASRAGRDHGDRP